MALTPWQVVIFQQVARAGSMSAAARHLGFRQPTVSAHIRQLEQTLGEKLLQRSATGVVPTEAGLRVLVHADAISFHLEQIPLELQERRLRQTGLVRLAGFSSALTTIMLPALMALRAKHPEITVDIAEASPDKALAKVGAGDADIALIYHHDDDREAADLSKFAVSTLAVDPVLLILPVGHRLAARNSLHLADLDGENWAISNTGCCTHVIELCQQAGFTAHIKYEGDNLTAIHEFVRDGLAVATVTRSSLTTMAATDLVVREIPELSAHRVSAACLPGAAQFGAVDVVTRYLQKAAVAATSA